MSSADLAGYIRKRLKTLGLTTVAAAEHSGISRQTWHKLLRAEVDEARLSTLVKVAGTLDTHPLNMLRVYFHGKDFTHGSNFSSTARKLASGFITDVTYPDNTEVRAGQEFEKIWEVVNLGTETWRNWFLQCVDENEPPAGQQFLSPVHQRVPIIETLPGEHTRIRARMRAPATAGTAVSRWQIVNDKGEAMFPELSSLYCMVNVSQTA